MVNARTLIKKAVTESATELDLVDLGLKEIPDELEELNDLIRLSLAHNKLASNIRRS